MDKVITRITIVLISLYFVLCYLVAQYMGVDIMRDSYILLLELCVVSYTFCSGKFHCKFMRWTALSILLADIVSHTDYYFEYIPLEWYNFIPLGILALGIGISITLALRHFHKVNKLRNKKNKINGN